MAWTVTDGRRGAPEWVQAEDDEDADGNEDGDYEDYDCDEDDNTDRGALSKCLAIR